MDATFARHRFALGIAVAFALSLFVILFITPAQAQGYWQASFADGAENFSTSGTVYVQYSHNIAGPTVVDENVRHVQLVDESGDKVSCHVYGLFQGSSGADEPGSAERQKLYIDFSGLDYETTYTIRIPSGVIRTAGGNFAEGFSISFTTGEDPNPPKEPDPPEDPDPPSTPEGGSGNGGMAATGGKDDHGTGSGAGDASGAGSGNTSGAGDGALTSDSEQAQTSEQPAEAGASGASRAAGTGNGSVYVIQGTGAGTGLSDGNSLMDAPPAFNLSWLLALLIAALAAAAFVFGAVKRSLWWNKHTQQGRG